MCRHSQVNKMEADLSAGAMRRRRRVRRSRSRKSRSRSRRSQSLSSRVSRLSRKLGSLSRRRYRRNPVVVVRRSPRYVVISRPAPAVIHQHVRPGPQIQHVVRPPAAPRPPPLPGPPVPPCVRTRDCRGADCTLYRYRQGLCAPGEVRGTAVGGGKRRSSSKSRSRHY